ncbi:lipopolysaccharide biosynthesis protein [Roseibium sp.]|uniref:lipopolysaccharide biosynthesis protein n=1 Tax=Roseibium sp. TaxID=1936156 RepID=UPI003A969FD5
MRQLLGFLQQISVMNFIWSMGSRFGSTVLSFLVLYAASHSLPTAEYGLYIFLFSVGSSLGLIFVFGQHVLLVKHYRLDGHARGETNQGILLANASWLAFGSAVLVLAASVTWAYADRLETPYNSLPIAFLFAAIFALSEYFQNYFRIHGRIALALGPRENIWRILCAMALPALAYSGYMTSGATAAEVVTLLLGVTVTYQFVKFLQFEGIGFIWRRDALPSRDIWRTWRTETGFFTANSFFNSAASYFETILIGLLLDLEAAAFYFVAFRISMLLTLPVLAIDTVGIPLISACFQENDRRGAQRITAFLSAGSFALALIGGLFLYFFGGFILSQFDPNFEQHFGILLILCLGAITSAFFGPGTWLIMIGNGEKYLLVMRTIVFVVYLAALGILGYELGLAGVAVASWLQLLAVHLFSRRWVIRRWQVDNAATSLIAVLSDKSSKGSTRNGNVQDTP